MYSLTPTVKNLLIINLLMFGVNFICNAIEFMDLTHYLGLHYFGFEEFKLYQIFTYFFIEIDPLRMFFAGLSLYFFGTMLEQMWGSKKFLNFYLLSGVLTGIAILLIEAFFAWKLSGTVLLNNDTAFDYNFQTVMYFGTRWIMFSIWTALALIFPNFEVYLYFIIPVKIKYIWIFIVISEVVSMISGAGFYGLYILLSTAVISYLLIRYYIGQKINLF